MNLMLSAQAASAIIGIGVIGLPIRTPSPLTSHHPYSEGTEQQMCLPDL
jgi:hypothetical protein